MARKTPRSTIRSIARRLFSTTICAGVCAALMFAACDDTLPVPAENQPDQTALDTTTRREPDQSWDLGIDGHAINWRYISFRPLQNSICVIGVVKAVLVNRRTDQDVSARVLIRLRGADGFQHVPETPLRQIHIPAADSIAISENFILEVQDPATANAITRLIFSLF